MRRFLLVLALCLGMTGGTLAFTAGTASAASKANCEKYVGLFKKYGLPVSTFKAIAWRESGCNPKSFVMNRTDSGGGLLGINLKGKLAAAWKKMCGATLANITNAEINVKCAKAAYKIYGLKPWRVSKK